MNDLTDHRGFPLTRRNFINRTGAAAAIAAGASTLPLQAATAKTPETIVKQLYDTLSEKQRTDVCFDWDHQDEKRGLLRTFVANNWNVTKAEVGSRYYTDEQRDMIRAIFKGMIHPDWHERYEKQLNDDAGGFGRHQSIAVFGKPGTGKFEFVLTGRHMTLRCDGDSAEHVAFGGPIFYGHAPKFNERKDHEGNVFWEQAVEANKLYTILDGKQREKALVKGPIPREQSVGFQGKDGPFVGIPVADCSADQKGHVQKVLGKLLEMYRKSDQDEVVKCLNAQGGLDACHLGFYEQADLGNDDVWDNWRLEGPSFVWYFRGKPHVHVWVNVADDASVKTNA
jgi:hypothetical protein